jgi:hypothetical protein
MKEATVPLFKKKPKAPAPEPGPPLPPELQAVWDTYVPAGDEGRPTVIRRMSEWEARLPAPQRSHFRAEIVSTIMSTAGNEVGQVWQDVGIHEGWQKGVSSLTLAYEAVAAEVDRRPLREAVWMIPIQDHYEAIIAVRDDLIREARKK